MTIVSSYIECHLNESFGFEMGEVYEELLYDWYGEDLSLFDPDDEDLAIALTDIRKISMFWRTCPVQMSSYEKLRRLYDALLELYLQLVEDYNAVCLEKEQLALACQKVNRKILTLTIKGGCGSAAIERRFQKHVRNDAA
jgi:hypothetical protein